MGKEFNDNRGFSSPGDFVRTIGLQAVHRFFGGESRGGTPIWFSSSSVGIDKMPLNVRDGGAAGRAPGIVVIPHLCDSIR